LTDAPEPIGAPVFSNGLRAAQKEYQAWHTTRYRTSHPYEPSARGEPDTLIAPIKERRRLCDLSEELQNRADEIVVTLPKDVQEGGVWMTLAGFDEPLDFHSETEARAFANGIKVAGLKRQHVPHWDCIVECLQAEFRAAKKSQIDDVLEAAGVAALREARSVWRLPRRRQLRIRPALR
jgi:hypothetical protein